jgi:hypothetical protein
MAKTRLAIASKELQLHLVGDKGSYKAARVQRLNINTDIPVTQVDELGSAQHAGSITDIPAITLTFSAFDVGINLFAVLTGEDQDAYPAGGVDIEQLTEIDAIMFVRDDDVTDYVKAAHAKRLQIRDFTFTYSVDGESTEEYTAIGSEKRWFKNDVAVDTFTAGTTSFTLSDTPVTLKNGDELLTVILDGKYLTEVPSGPATGEYSVSGTTLTTFDTRTDTCVAVYQRTFAGSEWTDVSDTEQAVAIRGKDVELKLGVNSMDRVQSVTINGNLNSQPVTEMHNQNILGYQSQVPTVNGTVTVLDTDTELMDLLVTGQPSSGDTEFEITGGCATSGLALEVVLYDPCDTATALKTVYVPSFRTTGDAYTSNVNENASQTFNWESFDAQCIVYSGARP